MAAANVHNLASTRWRALRVTDNATDRDSVIAKTVPRGHRYQFCVTRHSRSGCYVAEKLSADFTNKEFVMAARRQPSFNKNIYVLSSESDNVERRGQAVVGKLKTNTAFGNSFTLVDAGHSATARTPAPDVVSSQCELASVLYNVGANHPRIITVILPALSASVQQPSHIRTTPNHDGLLEKYHNNILSEIIVLRNKTPVWDPERKTYVLDFFGRVLRSSVKNFQLLDSHNDIVLSFGRRSKNQFALDFTYPLSTTQAFGIALSALKNKFGLI